MFKFGADVLLSSRDQLNHLKQKKVALVAHQAAVTSRLEDVFDCLHRELGASLVSAFGPQHGMRGEKQDNMVESEDYVDPRTQVQVHSLYGEVRRPKAQWMQDFDILLFDLQDVGCRIYTFLTTLVYMMEACEKAGKEMWVLDRPNPAGRVIEGVFLDEALHSFVGAVRTPLRHGMTLGELARWYKSEKQMNLELQVIPMEGYSLEVSPAYGWPSVAWVNPSPNIPSQTTCRSFSGTVLIEGTWLSEGRGTTRPLEVIGGPGMDGFNILRWIEGQAPHVLQGARFRPCFFEPTFQKLKGQLCGGVQIHTEEVWYQPALFKPLRFVAMYLRAVRQLYPDFDLFRPPPYEYETEKMPLDMLWGQSGLRLWVDDLAVPLSELEKVMQKDEAEWAIQSQPFRLYDI